MRILVYGAGVQGCELAHRLLQNKKNVVTLLARGEWKERIDQKGLVIRSMLQFRTTTDRVATIDTLAPDDCYDLVFVAMQAGQLPQVLPILKQNKSEYFVFLGNDPDAVGVLRAMQRPADKIAFGFQNTAGRREPDRLVSVHTSVGMTVGGATAPLSGVFRQRLQSAFDGVKYKLTYYDDMDEWLKCHIAFILPIVYVCYAVNGDLTRFHGGAAQSHRGRGVGVLRDAEGSGCPCERRREHRLLPGGHQEAEADRPDGILDVPDAHRKVVRFRPRDARHRGNAVPRRSLRGPARKHPSLHDRVG